MMYSKRAMVLITLLYGLLAIYTSKAEANSISLLWSGHLTNVVSFGHEAVPAGISQGSPIMGSLTFEPEQYSSTYGLLGNIFAGNVYRYREGLQQTINIGLWEWVIKGADISLTNSLSLSYPQQAFDSFSTSENHDFDLFPNYVGTFEYGFALFDNNLPLKLFDYYEIQNLHLALDEISDAGGFLTTRLWDDHSNIVDGYYLIFEIDKVEQASYMPVPEPSTLLLLGSGLAGLLAGIRKRFKT